MRFPALVDEWKQQAAERALAYVEDGMLVGLGTGSTAARFVDLVGQRVKQGLSITCVPTSEATRVQAERLGIALTTLDDVPFLDLTVDGADELDDDLRLIKGGGGALLREKIVAMASERMVVIADASKRVGVLGKFPLPVEAVRFGLTATRTLIGAVASDAGCTGEIKLRLGQGRQAVRDRQRQRAVRLRVLPHRQSRGARPGPEAGAGRGRERPLPRHRRRRHHRRPRRRRRHRARCRQQES